MHHLTVIRYISAGALVLAAGPALDLAAHPQMQQAREQTADQQVQHVLSRLAFGARPGDVQKVREMGVDAWIELQLHPEKIPDTPADQFVRVSYPTLEKSAKEIVTEYPRPDNAAEVFRGAKTAADSARARQEQQQVRQQANRVNIEVQSSKVARAVLSERQLNEVMVDFWENHFSVYMSKGQVRYYLTEYDQVIRQHALGNFRELLEAVAKSPAMLFYLDNWQSAADSNRRTLLQVQCGIPAGAIVRDVGRAGRGGRGPCAGIQVVSRGGIQRPLPNQQQRRRPGLNENFARELMELHTLGVDGGYTQQDVIEVARALTGWTIQNPQNDPVFVFRPATHDAESKVVLGRKLAPGRGMEDGEQVLDIVAGHPSTAKFIATKLARRFVSDSPPGSVVDRAAATFTRTKGDIREVVRSIVTSPEFFSAEAYRSKVKTPFELVASTLRSLNALPDPTQRTAQVVAQLGQPIWGKETPNGYPDVADQWMNTGAILNRINFGTAAAAGTIPGLTLDRWPATATLRTAAREEQVDGVIAALLGGAASPDTRDILLSGENPFLAANAGAAGDSTNAMGGSMQPPPTQQAARGGRAGRAGTAGQPPQGAGRRGGRGGDALGRGPAPNLEGLAQVVGLALGSPEFQRR